MPTIPNTTIEIFMDRVYRITPNEGYVLHNKSRDWTEGDPMMGEEEVLYRGYSTVASTVPLSYDFDNTTEIDGYTAYGSKEIFARPRSEVPENQIFGGGNNEEHEVM